MLTQKTQKVIFFDFRNCCFTKCIPFDWDGKTKRLKPIKGKLIYLYYLNACYTFFNAVFLILSFLHVRWSEQTRSFLSIAVHGVFCCVFTVTFIFHYNTYKRRDQLAEFLNQFLKLTGDLQDEFKTEGLEMKRDLCERTVLILSCVAYLDCFIISILFLQYRNEPRYLFSYLPIQEGSPLLIIFWFLAVWDYVVVWHVCLFNLIIVFSYLFSTNIWLSEISLGNKDVDSLCEKNLRTSKTVIFVFRCHQLLNKNFNSCFSPIVLPVSVSIMVGVVISCNVLAIKFQSQLPLSTLIALPAASIYFIAIIRTAFPAAAGLHTLSIKFLTSWKGKCDMFSKKCFSSCRPLRVKACPFFIIQELTSLKALAFTGLYTWKTLLLTQEDGDSWS